MTTSASLTDTQAGSTWRIAISIETLAYLIILTIVLVLRWIGLGMKSLGELEAQQAISAWHLLWPDIPGSGSIGSVLTFAGAAISFSLATPTNAAARFVPMLGGMALVFTPLLFRERLGRLVTLLSIVLLALSPTAVAASRQLDGSGLAMLGLVLALAAFDRYAGTRRVHLILLAGMALGFSLLADFGALLALVTMAGGLAFIFLTGGEDQPERLALNTLLRNLPWRAFFAGLVGTLVIVGTLFFIAPDGLGAAADQLGRLADGLIHRPAGAPYLGLVILLYEPGLLLFGAIGMVLAYLSGQAWQRFLAGWGITALLVSLIYPGAMPFHSLWSIVPLATLSGLALAALLTLDHEAPVWGPWAHAATVAASFGMMFVRLSHHLRDPLMLVWPPNAPPEQAMFRLPGDLLMVLVWFVLLIIVWLAVANLWEARSAWRGLGLGVAIPLLLIDLGQSGSLAFTRADSPYELVNQYPTQAPLTTLVDTAQQVSELATGDPNLASITVQSDPNGALAWALRDFKDITYVQQATPEVQTILVITPADGADPSLGSSYVGQDLVIMRHWGPGGLTAKQLASWMLYRTAPDTPAGEMRVILWVREDIYRLIPAGGAPLPDVEN